MPVLDLTAPMAELNSWLAYARAYADRTDSYCAVVRVGQVWLTPDEALDASLATYAEFVRAFSAAGSQPDSASIQKLAWTRYRARAIDQYRRRRLAEKSLALLPREDPEPAHDKDVEDRDQLLEAYRDADPATRILLFLRGLGLPFREAAGHAGLKEATARKRISRFAEAITTI